jgi:hypothetical protein
MGKCSFGAYKKEGRVGSDLLMKNRHQTSMCLQTNLVKWCEGLITEKDSLLTQRLGQHKQAEHLVGQTPLQFLTYLESLQENLRGQLVRTDKELVIEQRGGPEMETYNIHPRKQRSKGSKRQKESRCYLHS